MEPSITDPFAPLAEEPRTFVKPNPGARTRMREPAAVFDDDNGTDDRTASLGEAPAAMPAPHGLNPLLALANALLLAVPPLRATMSVADLGALRNSLAQALREFAANAAAAGIGNERVMAARYVLCTMLDEAAASTPWGGSGAWARHSLLAMFHNEVEGGEKVFQLMARLAEKPDANRDLLELIYAALALGFEGRYKVLDNGRAQLDAVRDRLAQIVKQQRGDYAPALAQHWRGEPVQRRAAASWLPLAASAAVAALVMTLTYLAFAFSLSGRSDPVYESIQSLRLPPPVAVAVQPAPKPRLAQLLQSDIKAGLVAVRDEVDRSVVTLRGDGLFASGSASLTPQREPLMQRIGDALAQFSGQVLVTGHTDSERIRSARFPSNWHLSEARAKTVRDLLVARNVAADRVRAEGRADGDPVASNDTPANRALNRRVEVTLAVARGGDPAAKTTAEPVRRDAVAPPPSPAASR